MPLTVSYRSCYKPNRIATVPSYLTPSKPPIKVQQNQHVRKPQNQNQSRKTQGFTGSSPLVQRHYFHCSYSLYSPRGNNRQIKDTKSCTMTKYRHEKKNCNNTKARRVIAKSCTMIDAMRTSHETIPNTRCRKTKFNP